MAETNNLKQCFNQHSINLASLAVQAVLYEVSCHPSPGLVSIVSSGAHKDMDYFTFLDSAVALIQPLIQCAEAGFSSYLPQQIFKEIRLIGQLGEQEMFAKTTGINTHKGMLFLLGICCAAGGKALYSGSHFSSLPTIIRDMTWGLVERELSSRYNEFKNADEFSLTYGEKLFLHHRVEGIRGEVQRGLPTVFGISLEFYKASQGLSKRQRLVQTLVAIMQSCEDSNILHRHGFETLREVQERAKRVIFLGGVETLQGMKEIEAMDRDFSIRKISPGGSADLLGVTVFLQLLEDYMKKIEVGD
ncbi:MAG: triphosphoribosyl-dephospho-CoA synthase CitG [Desulfosporosinus sp.]|nr:triphosphoribosyl-dephospho-CoA synthase CitG [Desulfosporosinus sp.]